MKSATFSMRVDPVVKEAAEHTFASLGMTVSEAVSIFLHRAVMEGGMPFDVRQRRYSPLTETAMREADGIVAGRIVAERYRNPAELGEALGLEIGET
ncbi:MAG: type II toxin-antitoxin system RelB/DinJ family antitoxin [Bifidobacteriaceae bacterium]|nr:type II toxin-antitoxin system RelB/DinJ family antitoxin [Bifidobacteriaceae bacterium]